MIVREIVHSRKNQSPKPRCSERYFLWDVRTPFQERLGNDRYHEADCEEGEHVTHKPYITTRRTEYMIIISKKNKNGTWSLCMSVHAPKDGGIRQTSTEEWNGCECCGDMLVCLPCILLRKWSKLSKHIAGNTCILAYLCPIGESSELRLISSDLSFYEAM